MSAEHLPDDFAAAIKAADDYADTLATLAEHDLPQHFAAWLTTVATPDISEHAAILRSAGHAYGGQS